MKNINKILTILITHHEEPLDVVEPLFQTLNIQIGNVFKNIHIIISDNSVKNHLKISDIRPYSNIYENCDLVQNLNCVTISSHLNQLISQVSTPYFMMYDCDDRVCDISSFQEVLRSIKQYPDTDVFQFGYYQIFLNNPKNITKGLAVSGGWGCVYKKSTWLRECLQYADVSSEHDIGMHYCICQNTTIKRLSFPEISVVCWCRRDDSVSAGFYKSETQFLDNFKNVLLMLLYVKKYYISRKIPIQNFVKIFNGEIKQLENRVQQYEKINNGISENLLFNLQSVANQFIKTIQSQKDLN